MTPCSTAAAYRHPTRDHDASHALEHGAIPGSLSHQSCMSGSRCKPFPNAPWRSSPQSHCSARSAISPLLHWTACRTEHEGQCRLMRTALPSHAQRSAASAYALYMHVTAQRPGCWSQHNCFATGWHARILEGLREMFNRGSTSDARTSAPARLGQRHFANQLPAAVGTPDPFRSAASSRANPREPATPKAIARRGGLPLADQRLERGRSPGPIRWQTGHRTPNLWLCWGRSPDAVRERTGHRAVRPAQRITIGRASYGCRSLGKYTDPRGPLCTATAQQHAAGLSQSSYVAAVHAVAQAG